MNRKSVLSFDRLSLKNRKAIRRAYLYAFAKHRGQKRDSGEPYITHPLGVALILFLELEITDEKLLCAAFLHDVIEDCNVSLLGLTTQFGSEKAGLVFTVTKVSPVGPEPADIAERSIQVHIAWKRYTHRIIHDSDWRGVVLKLADILHNARTLKRCSPEKVRRFKEKFFAYYLEILKNLEHRGERDYELRLFAKFFRKAIFKELHKYTHM